MEDGTQGQALLLLAWPLAILGLVVAGILLIFPRTRKLAWPLVVIIVFALCAAHLVGALSGRKRVRATITTEQSVGGDSGKAADGLTGAPQR